ncbi:MAG TPA: M48 family metallopeptidase [Chryseosolibacter sp.]|nr:M48 family metallopeptidase [Chryseosolibacter sp.]
MIKRVIVFSLLALFLYACAKVAVTGRQQLSLVPSSEIIPMAEQQYDSVVRNSKLSNDARQTAMVKNVGSRIQKAVERYMSEHNASSDLSGFNWEFNLIDDPNTVNAWCMPGGKVAFYTGIMPICQDEAGVAVVMGHEIAHAIAHHAGERMSQGLLANGLLGTLGAALGQNPTLTQQVFLQAVGVGAQLGMLKFSRQQESEADHIGLIFMAMAGYDPHEAPKFWERMVAQSGGGQPPEWLSTHPSHGSRIKDLNKEIPEAMKYYKK